jgi:hypothetical protein
MQMNLTPFRKTRRPAVKRPRRPVPRTSPKTAKRPFSKEWLDTLDAIDERCARIETMAGLLRACDEPEEMTVKLAASAGAFMADDLREIKGLLAGLGRGTP